ncbi:hypothetical protein COCON_G00071070 [Conger conger]|uniref:DUF5523 domain-containing protein n=1 Tax=Conger conger TaxID=82655 RepID=A0A9Q1I4F0_CONCO|nr:hypothetical protein COCON_G00071070 [Conger conger]
MASSSSDLREKIRQKRRALRESLAKDKRGTDTQELTATEEDQVESLKRSLKDQRQRRKKKLLKDVSSEDLVEELAGAGAGAGAGPVRQGGASLEPVASTSGVGRSSRGQSQSEVSMRQRMREKLQAARSKSLQQEAVEPGGLLALRDRDAPTRFDREDSRPGSLHHDDVPTAARVRFREAAARVRQKPEADAGLPTAEEAYNFFTFTFDPEPPEEPAKGGRKRRMKARAGMKKKRRRREQGRKRKRARRWAESRKRRGRRMTG